MRATPLILTLLGCFVLLSACASENEGVSDLDGDLADGDGDAVEEAENDGEEADGDSEEDRPVGMTFVEFEWQNLPDDIVDTRLCAEAADPENAPDTIYIDCAMEGENYVETPHAPKDNLLVVAYNMERGYKVDEIIQQFQSGSEVAGPDVILVSEADRGCSRTGRRYILQDIAKALKMYFVYGVEFIELPREEGSGGQITAMCEHGNGILSRYPLGNVRLIRHQTNVDWSGDAGEPRLGGRMAITADVKVGERYLGLSAIHFESSLSDEPRHAQALEMIADIRERPVPVVIGGDFNSGFYKVDLQYGTDTDQVIRPFLDAGFFDAHQSLPVEERTTAPHSGFLLDLMLCNADVFSDPGIGSRENFAELSDHLPVWATVTVP